MGPITILIDINDNQAELRQENKGYFPYQNMFDLEIKSESLLIL